MIWVKRCFLFSILCLAVSLHTYSQTLEQELDLIASGLFRTVGPGISVLVAKDNKVIYRKAFGKANLELDVLMKPGFVFRIGSITKQFTAIAILQLAEQRKLSLNDSLIKFIRDYPPAAGKVTIENLLTHTSGIRNYTDLPEFKSSMRTDRSSAELIQFFKNEPLNFPPGSAYQYSNSNYILLGFIIEQVSGLSYQEYIQQHIFDSLEMQHSGFDRSEPIIAGRASGYQRKEGKYQNADFLSMTLPYAAGSLRTNTDDLLKWYSGLINHKLVSPKSLEKAFTNYQLLNKRTTGYGYGWEIGNVQGIPTVKHVGRINGFVTYAVFIPGAKLVVEIFTNCDCTDNLDVPASKMAGIVLKKPYKFSPANIAEKELQQYQGIYIADSQEKIIRLEDGVLRHFSPEQNKVSLVPLGSDRFLLEGTLTTFRFTRGEKGKINGYKLSNTGQSETWVQETDTIQALHAISLPSAEKTIYTGNYQVNSSFLLSVELEDNKLFGRVGQFRIRDFLEIHPILKAEIIN